MNKKTFVGIFLSGLILLASALCIAQTTTATLSGTITDESGGVLPGVQVTITNSSTGAKRALTTDAGGRFVAPQLLPDKYDIAATLAGFETSVRQGITLTVGQEASINLAMKVGTVTEQVTVTAEAPLLDTSSSAVAGVVDEKRIQELPLNGRDFSQLPLVQPGVLSIRNADPTVANKGYGQRISMGGTRADQTAWLLDGTNIKSPSNFGTPGSAAGVMLGVDAVREFQVLTSNYSAEFGKSSGGVINIISKSGTNQLHGSAYEFLRNSDLDARNFFDIPNKAPFKRNQFGASIGGPIKKDKTFFFGNYEGLRQRQGITNLDTVPDANFHQGLLPGVAPVTVAPEIRPFLALWPLPNGGELLDSKGNPSGFGNLYAPANSSVNEDFFVVRVDHHLNDSQTLFGRFTFDQGNLVQPDPIPITQFAVNAHTRYVTAEHENVVSPRFLMTSRVAFNRTLLSSNDVPTISYPSNLNLFLAGVLPGLAFPGPTPGFGPSTTNIFLTANNLYEFSESFQYLRGNHSMKFGVDVEKVGYNRFEYPAGSNGTLTWTTPTAFLQDATLTSFAARATGSDTFRTWTWYEVGTYFQDDWKVGPHLTLNLGVRYEPMTVPTEKHGRDTNLVNWTTDTAFTVGQLYQNPTMRNVSPRVGFAWDPKGDGKTSIRGGFGIFFVDYSGAYFGTPGDKDPPFAASTASVLGNLASAVSDMARISPGLLTPAVTPNTLPDIINFHLKPSYDLKANFAIERQLPGGMALSVGYLGDRGVHLWRLADINDLPTVTLNGRPGVIPGTPRVNPLLGAGSIRNPDAQSFYNSLQVGLNRRFSHGFQFQTSYTWSRNVDDSSTGVAFTDYIAGGNGGTSMPYDPKADRGLSNLNVGQNLVISGIYDIPGPAGSRIASALLGGWQLANIFSAGSGVPFSVYVSGRNANDGDRTSGIQHPDRPLGTSMTGIVTGNPNQYFNPTAFVLPPPNTYGNAGRNILIGPGLLNFDLSLKKAAKLPISEASRLEFHADFFNIFNRANFAVPANLAVLNPTNGAYIAGAGQITRTVTSSRQLQFGLKLTF